MRKLQTLVSNVIDTIICTPDDEQNAVHKIIADSQIDLADFQKSFKQRTGLTPAQVIRYKKYRQADNFLLQGYSTLDAAYQAGLSGQGRLHDNVLQIETATPSEVKLKGRGLNITYGVFESVLGQLFIAQTGKGICWIVFDKSPPGIDSSLLKLRKKWPYADIEENTASVMVNAEKINAFLEKRLSKGAKIALNLYGTSFQVQVWQALIKIPQGVSINYQAIGCAIGKPKASRAVGSAVGANPMSWLIPCHRVIQASGLVENYASGTARKTVLLGLETAL